MLIRQRAILRLIEKAGRPLSNTVVFKLAFLLRQETTLADDSTFYDFLPYRFGPYSFAMHRELETLTAYGYLKAEKAGTGTRFARGTMLSEYELPTAVDKAIGTILQRYLETSQRDLVRDVYARYPWYAINTELRELLSSPLPARKEPRLAVYTIGYHRASVDFFANRLLREGIRNVVDVRANPVSRKYGFAGSSLGLICRKVGVGYHHFPRLGIPSSDRKGVTGTEAFERLFLHYEQHILTKNRQDVTLVSALAKSVPSVLLCAEQDAAACHRSRLAAVVSDSTGLPAINF